VNMLFCRPAGIRTHSWLLEIYGDIDNSRRGGKGTRYRLLVCCQAVAEQQLVALLSTEGEW